MGAGTTCLKVIFVLMSILALIVAAGFVGVGVVVKWFLGILLGLLLSLIGIADLTSVYTSIGLPTAQQPNLQTMDFSQFLGDPFLLGMIAVGAVAMIVLFLGMIGACCSRGVLIFFLVVYALIWVLQLVSFLLFMLGTLDTSIKTHLQSSLDLFQGAVFTDTPSVFWSATQYLLQCCGLDSYSDIKTTTEGGKWDPEPRIIKDEVIRQAGPTGYFTPMTYPLACCKKGKIAYTTTLVGAIPTVAFQCTQTTTIDSNRDKGCYTYLMDLKSQNSTMIYGAVGGWLGFQLLLLIVAICLVVLMKKKKTTPREKMPVTEGRDPRSRPPPRPLEPYPETRHQPPERYPEPRYAAPERYPEPPPERYREPRYPAPERYPEPLRVPREPRFVAPSPRPPSPVRPAPPPYETIPRPRPNANAFFQAQRR